MILLGRVVEYLRSNGVPFRLLSFPSQETEPAVAFPPHALGAIVESRVVLIDGRLGIAAMASGRVVNVAGLRNELNAKIVEEGRFEDLPWPFSTAGYPPPAFTRLFGVPVFLDEALGEQAVLCFRAFAPTDFIEVTYDDYVRLEQPRVGNIAEAGELPPAPLH